MHRYLALAVLLALAAPGFGVKEITNVTPDGLKDAGFRQAGDFYETGPSFVPEVGWKMRVGVGAGDRNGQLTGAVNALLKLNEQLGEEAERARAARRPNDPPVDRMFPFRFKVLTPTDHDRVALTNPEQAGKYITIYMQDEKGPKLEAAVKRITGALYDGLDGRRGDNFPVKSDVQLVDKMPLYISYGVGSGDGKIPVPTEQENFLKLNGLDKYLISGEDGKPTRNKDGQLMLDDNKFRRQGGNAVPPWQIPELTRLKKAAEATAEDKDRARAEARREGTSPSSVVDRSKPSSPRPGDLGAADLSRREAFGETSRESVDAGGRWENPPLAKNLPPIIYSELPNDQMAAPPKPTSPRPYTDFESQLAQDGLNVQKLRTLNTQMSRDVQNFYYNTKPGVGEGRTGRVMADAAAKGLFAIPDSGVSRAIDQLIQSRDKQGRFVESSSNNGALPLRDAARLVTDYLTTNSEMALIRRQVTDPARMKALTDWQEAIDPTGGKSPRSRDTIEALRKTMKDTWGFARSPTKDETEGLKLWKRYFEGRETQGERTVGNLLDTPFLKKSAELMRYGGRNQAPADVRPEDVKADWFKASEVAGDQRNDWNSARESIGARGREERRTDTDRKGDGK